MTDINEPVNTSEDYLIALLLHGLMIVKYLIGISSMAQAASFALVKHGYALASERL